jgi:hypothetical protein
LYFKGKRFNCIAAFDQKLNRMIKIVLFSSKNSSHVLQRNLRHQQIREVKLERDHVGAQYSGLPNRYQFHTLTEMVPLQSSSKKVGSGTNGARLHSLAMDTIHDTEKKKLMLPGLWDEDDVKRSPSPPSMARANSQRRTVQSPSSAVASLGTALSLRTTIGRAPARPASPGTGTATTQSARARTSSRTPRAGAPARRQATSPAAAAVVAPPAAPVAAAIAPGGANNDNGGGAAPAAIVPTGQNVAGAEEVKAFNPDADDLRIESRGEVAEGRMLYKAKGGKPFKGLPMLFNNEFMSDLVIAIPTPAAEDRPPIQVLSKGS